MLGHGRMTRGEKSLFCEGSTREGAGEGRANLVDGMGKNSRNKKLPARVRVVAPAYIIPGSIMPPTNYGLRERGVHKSFAD